MGWPSKGPSANPIALILCPIITTHRPGSEIVCESGHCQAHYLFSTLSKCSVAPMAKDVEDMLESLASGKSRLNTQTLDLAIRSPR